MAPVLPMLRDDNAEVRGAAVLALAKLAGGEKKIQEVLDVFKDDKDLAVRVDYAVALGEMGKARDSDVPQLVAGLDSNREALSDSAEKALLKIGKSGPDKVVPALAQALSQGHELLSTNALRVIRDLGPKAAEGLSRLTEFFPKSDARIRPLLLQTIVRLDEKGDAALPLLQSALKGDDLRLKVEALLNVPRYSARAPELLDALIACLQASESRVKQLAFSIIRGMGQRGEKAIPAIVAMLKETGKGGDGDLNRPKVNGKDYDRDLTNMKFMAIDMLAGYKPAPDAVFDAEESVLHDPAPHVRTRAVMALQRLGADSPKVVISILAKAMASEQDDSVKRQMEGVINQLQKLAVSNALKEQDNTAKQK